MAGVEEWHQGRPRQRVTQAGALLATAATVVDVLQARCAGGRTAVRCTLARQQPGAAGCPQRCTTFPQQTAPIVGLAIMVVIMATTRGTLQSDMSTDRITDTGTDRDA